MNARSLVGRVEVVADQEGLTSRAGTALRVGVADRVGLTDALAGAMRGVRLRVSRQNFDPHNPTPTEIGSKNWFQ